MRKAKAAPRVLYLNQGYRVVHIDRFNLSVEALRTMDDDRQRWVTVGYCGRWDQAYSIWIKNTMLDHEVSGVREIQKIAKGLVEDLNKQDHLEGIVKILKDRKKDKAERIFELIGFKQEDSSE